MQFLREQESGYVTTLICTRILPLYTVAVSVPYLVASANWVLGELGSCLPEVRQISILLSEHKQILFQVEFQYGSCNCYRYDIIWNTL